MLKPVTPSNLRAWREARGLNRAQAGALLGVSRQVWSAWELRKKPLKLGYVISLALWAVDKMQKDHKQ